MAVHISGKGRCLEGAGIYVFGKSTGESLIEKHTSSITACGTVVDSNMPAHGAKLAGFVTSAAPTGGKLYPGGVAICRAESLVSEIGCFSDQCGHEQDPKQNDFSVMVVNPGSCRLRAARARLYFENGWVVL